MLTYTLHIRVKPGHERQATATLATIEQHARTDDGCLQFTWLQHIADPRQFTLIEAWDSQQHLDAHLAKDPATWEAFTPSLAEEPVSWQLRPVRELTEPPAPDEVSAFVATWFQRLSDRAPVDELLPMVADEGLDMRFPDATLASHEDFRKWYEQVGQAFRDQSHEVLEVQQTPGADASVDLAVTVIWRATTIADGRSFASRATQSWRLRRSSTTAEPEIVGYHVESLAELAQPA
jgi:quinol monooxygenase YgiN